jgi:hypothetical protein
MNEGCAFNPFREGGCSFLEIRNCLFLRRSCVLSAVEVGIEDTGVSGLTAPVPCEWENLEDSLPGCDSISVA